MTAGPAPRSAMTAPATPATLRRLFLTLFLRGRTSRGLDTSSSPKSVAAKLWVTLVIYALVGASALLLVGHPIFVLSATVHATTFLLLGMFVAASAGEVLFNKEEADILLHRPIPPAALLWAKVRVLVEVSLWLAAALNLAAFIVGTMAAGVWFLVAHAVSLAMAALFCTGCVVLVYQLCLRWFGRQVLDHVMTASQVIVGVAIAAGSQVVPQLMGRLGGPVDLDLQGAWWLGLLPPVWFAAFDAAVAGGAPPGAWVMAAAGVVATSGVMWLAFGKLAREYGRGLQGLGETSAPPTRARTSRRLLDRLVDSPPLAWWLRDSVTRASFLLTARYLVRDRDVMLRVYPGLAPMLVMPFVFMLGPARSMGFGLAMTGGFVGLIPLMGLSMMRYSAQWQASDIFRAAPLAGPAPLCDGARRAVLCVLTVPMVVLFVIVGWLLSRDWSEMAVFVPGLLLLPVYSLVPCVGGEAVPLSRPGEEAKAAGRGARMFGITILSTVLAGLGLWSLRGGWFLWLIVFEAVAVVVSYVIMRRFAGAARWPSLE